MKIQITFFKPSGKYYTGGELEIGELHLWSDGFKQFIVDNQKIMMDGWQNGDWSVLTDDIEPTPKGWFHFHLWNPGSFAGLKRKET